MEVEDENSLIAKKGEKMSTQVVNRLLYDRLGITPKQLKDFCQRWKVAELELFGSILRDDFHAGSDIDVLVSYQSTAERGLFEKMHMKQELEMLCDRDVDLISKKAIERSKNWIRRQNILDSAEVIYVARSGIF